MLETYVNRDGRECCDNCGQDLDVCECRCTECGDLVVECACAEGPAYPAVTRED